MVDEKLTKSKERIKDFGEVFTPTRIVKDMCDQIPQETWDNIESTFLEPCCGNGNFLVEILERKLSRCKDERDGLKALASIVGIDIQQDNVDESRLRMLEIFCNHFPQANDFVKLLALNILENNIMCGDSLVIMDKWQKENEMRNPIVKVGKNGQMTLFE